LPRRECSGNAGNPSGNVGRVTCAIVEVGGVRHGASAGEAVKNRHQAIERIVETFRDDVLGRRVRVLDLEGRYGEVPILVVLVGGRGALGPGDTRQEAALVVAVACGLSVAVGDGGHAAVIVERKGLVLPADSAP